MLERHKDGVCLTHQINVVFVLPLKDRDRYGDGNKNKNSSRRNAQNHNESRQVETRQCHCPQVSLLKFKFLFLTCANLCSTVNPAPSNTRRMNWKAARRQILSSNLTATIYKHPRLTGRKSAKVATRERSQVLRSFGQKCSTYRGLSMRIQAPLCKTTL